MATKNQLNAVFDAVKSDIDQLVDDLVPAFFKSDVAQQLTANRILKVVKDGIAAYEKVKT